MAEEFFDESALSGNIKSREMYFQSRYRRELESYFRDRCLGLKDRQKTLWQRDYSSLDGYLESVKENRAKWSECLGVPSEPFVPFGNVPEEPFIETDAFEAKWIHVPLTDELAAHAVLAIPKGKSGPLPLVVAQHGLGSTPGMTFGFNDQSLLYDKFAFKLAESGYAVIAPVNVIENEPRARLHRMCLMLGSTLAGFEIAKLGRLLDYAEQLDFVDPERIAMWGLSLGGYYTLFTTPIEPRIKVAIIAAYFNHRLEKMVIDDPRYSCYISTQEEHIFIPGWLERFSDSDLLSLICPRPVMAQSGKSDTVSWWPFLVKEFERSRAHYEKLGIAERCRLDLHEGGHVVRSETGIAFLNKWL